jgi:ABC-type antimicrobial peptide transport system ATPase subunit
MMRLSDFAARPRALLMDEPFVALDAKTRGRLQEELLQIWEPERTTVLLVTYSIDEAVFLADRIVVFSPQPGRITATVTVELPSPRDPETPRFLALAKELRRMLVPVMHGAALGRGSGGRKCGKPRFGQRPKRRPRKAGLRRTNYRGVEQPGSSPGS